jgi:predicted signal transduction protein with EAL and GGDEF domain
LVGISIGVAEADTLMRGLDEVIRRADEALYAAKREGRNRVSWAPQSAGEARRSDYSERDTVADPKMARRH